MDGLDRLIYFLKGYVLREIRERESENSLCFLFKTSVYITFECACAS